MNGGFFSRLLIPLATDKVKIDAPADRITWIRRLVSAHRHIAFLHRFLDGSAEIRHGSDLLLIDLLNDGPNLDPGIVCTRVTNHLEDRDSLGPLKIQFLLNRLINGTNDNPEIFP